MESDQLNLVRPQGHGDGAAHGVPLFSRRPGCLWERPRMSVCRGEIGSAFGEVSVRRTEGERETRREEGRRVVSCAGKRSGNIDHST